MGSALPHSAHKLQELEVPEEKGQAGDAGPRDSDKAVGAEELLVEEDEL